MLTDVFPTLKKISVDFAVMEPASRDPLLRVAAVPMPLKWIDVGAWPMFAQTCPQDENGNALGTPRTLLRKVERSLLERDFKTVREGIEVRLVRSGSACSITVADDGPGVAPNLRSELSARFVRGEVEGEGCGLGLSIVARIAALSHARLELGTGLPRADGGHGFAATLHFSEAAIPA